MKQEEHRNWRIIHCSTRIFDTKKRESKQDAVWNTKLLYFWKGFPGQKKVQRGTCSTYWYIPYCHETPARLHTHHAGAVAICLARSRCLKAFRTNRQTSGNARQRARALKLFSHNTARWKRGLSPMKSRCMTAPSIIHMGLLRNKCSLAYSYVNTITLR